jgi:tetratricopeptide (TPR) repeat protein
MQRLLEQFEAQPGPPSGDLGRMYVNFGSMLLSLGAADSAAMMFEKALAIFEPMLGPNHVALAHTYMSMASAKLELRDPTAESWCLRARGAFVRISSPEAGEVAQIDGMLGEAYTQQRRFPEAMAAFERGIAGQERAFGNRDPRLGNTLAIYARSLVEMGDATAARSAAARAVEILSAALPEGHPDLVKAEAFQESLDRGAAGS